MAGLSRKGRGGKPSPHMNVTPLVDVVLVLLIIFMVVVPAMEERLSLEVPAVLNPDPERDEKGPEPLQMAVTRSGAVYLNDRRIVEGELAAHLAQAHARSPHKRLVLRGDRGVAYGDVRPLFAAAQSIGFPGVSLKVTHQEEDQRHAAKGE